MQAAESLVSLTDLPLLSVEFDFYYIVSISSMVIFILDHSSARDLHQEWDLKEYAPLTCAIFSALFHMIDESFSWEKDCAELALHR